MTTECARRKSRCRPRPVALRRALAALLLIVACVPAPLGAQVQVDGDTQVRSLRFSGARSLPERELRGALQTRERGSAYGLRSALARLPLIDPPPRHPFSPRVLQEDVVRLRRLYRRSGFPQVQVRYDVRKDAEQNLLDITFVIDEGRPLLVSDVTVTGPDSLAPLPVPEGERRSWQAMERRVRSLRGRRLDVGEARAMRARLESWWRDRGFPAAVAHGRLEADSARSEGSVRMRVFPGPYCRFGPINVADSLSISERAVERELPFREGDRYSEKALEEGRNELQQLEIVRLARLTTPALPPADSLSASPADSLLPVSVEIVEAKPRLVSGELGYVTDAGLSSEARWTHRNFTGEARSLTVAAVAQTGVLATTSNPDIRYRGSFSFQQPYFLDRRVSALLSPYGEYRDDIHDRSFEYGTTATLVYRLRPQLSASLDYRIAWRHIYEYRLEDLLSGDIDLLTFLTLYSQGLLDTLGSDLRTSVFGLTTNLGNLDDIANPRRGVLLRPAVQVTAPAGLTSTQYWRVGAAGYGFQPLSRRVTLAGRVFVGRLFPFGRSLPVTEDEGALEFLQLRDVTFTAGGSGDVRGWGSRLLGPKAPDLRIYQEGDSLRLEADGYVPVGGFSRTTFSLELRLPFPGLGPTFASHVFFDAGRVWTSDRRFNPGPDPYDEQRFFYATGAGMDVITPVGPIRVSVGYKLNPSIPDLVDSGDLLQAEIEGRPIDELKRHNSRRWHVHLAIGSSF